MIKFADHCTTRSGREKDVDMTLKIGIVTTCISGDADGEIAH
jgi:hypothetical protein